MKYETPELEIVAVGANTTIANIFDDVEEDMSGLLSKGSMPK